MHHSSFLLFWRPIYRITKADGGCRQHGGYRGCRGCRGCRGHRGCEKTARVGWGNSIRMERTVIITVVMSVAIIIITEQDVRMFMFGSRKRAPNGCIDIYFITISSDSGDMHDRWCSHSTAPITSIRLCQCSKPA